MSYRWRNLAFDLPAGLEDDTVLTFVGRTEAHGDINVTCVQDSLDEAIDPYLAAAVDDMARSFPDYKLLEQSSREVAGLSARILEQSIGDAESESLLQFQAYLPHGKDITIFTATGQKAARSQIVAALDDILRTFRIP